MLAGILRFWIRKLFNNFYDSHRILEQPFFQVICLFLHLFPFNVRCSTFIFSIAPSPFNIRC